MGVVRSVYWLRVRVMITVCCCERKGKKSGTVVCYVRARASSQSILTAVLPWLLVIISLYQV